MEVTIYAGLTHYIPNALPVESAPVVYAPVIAAAETFGAVMVADLLAAGVKATVTYDINCEPVYTHCTVPNDMITADEHWQVVGPHVRAFYQSMSR